MTLIRERALSGRVATLLVLAAAAGLLIIETPVARAFLTGMIGFIAVGLAVQTVRQRAAAELPEALAIVIAGTFVACVFSGLILGGLGLASSDSAWTLVLAALALVVIRVHDRTDGRPRLGSFPLRLPARDILLMSCAVVLIGGAIAFSAVSPDAVRPRFTVLAAAPAGADRSHVARLYVINRQARREQYALTITGSETVYIHGISLNPGGIWTTTIHRTQLGLRVSLFRDQSVEPYRTVWLAPTGYARRLPHSTRTMLRAHRR